MDYVVVVIIVNVMDLVWVGKYLCIHSCDGDWSKIDVESSSILNAATGFEFLFDGCDVACGGHSWKFCTDGRVENNVFFD
jgi:hypothetical protein